MLLRMDQKVPYHKFHVEDNQQLVLYLAVRQVVLLLHTLQRLLI